MIDCHRCKHYYVTWEASFAHGCRAMGFKASQIPSAVVRASSGMECLQYAARPRRRPAKRRSSRSDLIRKKL